MASLGPSELIYWPLGELNEILVKVKLVQVMDWCHQQPITWANVDPVLCRYMASLGHSELIVHFNDLVQGCGNSSALAMVLLQSYLEYYQACDQSYQHKLEIFEECRDSPERRKWTKQTKRPCLHDRRCRIHGQGTSHGNGGQGR